MAWIGVDRMLGVQVLSLLKNPQNNWLISLAGIVI
jgi:hypothetical protein